MGCGGGTWDGGGCAGIICGCLWSPQLGGSCFHGACAGGLRPEGDTMHQNGSEETRWWSLVTYPATIQRRVYLTALDCVQEVGNVSVTRYLIRWHCPL